MRIKEKGGIFLIVNFVLLFTMQATGSQSKWEEQEPLLAYLMELGVINQEKAELLRGDCMLDWLHSKKNGQVLGLELILERSTYSDKLLSSRASRLNFYDTLDALFNQVDQVLEDCAREKKIMLSDASEDSYSDICLTRYYSFLFNHRCSSARRALAQTSGEAPALSPILVPTPAPSFPLAPHEIPASPPLLISPPDFGKSSDIASGEHSSNQRTSNRTVIIAVVVTATVTIVITAFFFLYYRRCCPFGSPRGRNDERPLLSISLGHQSTAEAQKSFRLGSQVDEEKFGDQSFHNKVNHNKFSENLYVESHYVSNSKIEIPVATTVVSAAISAKNSSEMPPRLWGKPVLPPLKPPPGRVEPLKPPVGNAASLPPPPSRLISSPLLKPSPSGSNALPDRPKPPPPPIPGPIKPSPVGTMVPPPPPPPTPGVNLVPPRAPPPPPPGVGVGVARPVPPAPPVVGAPPPPPRPPAIGLKPPRVVPPGQHPPASSISTGEVADGTAKAKLKPFFWDKVLANPDHSMVWHQIKSGSFQFNEEMIETLFGYTPAEKNKNEGKKESSPRDGSTYIRLIDPKKAQNLSILLKALNVTTEEVYDALVKGHELPPELIQTLMKMAPTTEEELKLRLYAGELSQLGPAERFLKVLVDIPFAFKRLESLLFMCTLEEEMSLLKESFAVLEAACTELRESRLFLKLLEAVLKTGNRMNDGTFRGGAQAFKLDTLLKLSDVKGTDGKTTLLLFVVEEIIRSEGKRAARDAKVTSSTSSFKSDDLPDEQLRSLGLQVVSSLGDELQNVKKAANLDVDSLTGTVVNLGKGFVKARDFLNSDMKTVRAESGFHQILSSFVQTSEIDITRALEEEKRIMVLVRSTSAYFHGHSGKDEGLRLFVIVRDFLIVLDNVCKQVKKSPQKLHRPSKEEEDPVANPSEPRQTRPSIDIQQMIFPVITERRMNESSSEDES